MICKCSAEMKCLSTRQSRLGTRRRWICPECEERISTLERPISEWENSTPNSLDRLALHLTAISTLTKEAAEVIHKHLLGDQEID